MTQDAADLNALLDQLSLIVEMLLAGPEDDSAVAEIGPLLGKIEIELDRPSAVEESAVRAHMAQLRNILEEIGRTPAADQLPMFFALVHVVHEAQASLRHRAKAEAARAGGPNVVRDAETVELIQDFVSEAAELLTTADEILMAVEQDGLDPEKVNALFRVFHTIKGGAGFLDFDDIISLAHTTETLLDQVREGQVELEGPPLDHVFEATTMTRRLLDAIRTAVEGGVEVEPVDMGELLAALGAHLTRGTPVIPVTRGTPVKQPEVAATVDDWDMPPPTEASATEEDDEAPAAELPRAILRSAPEPAREARGENAPSDGPAAPQLRTRARETLKVDVDRVESFVEMVGELIIVQSMVVHAPEITSLQNLRIQGYLSQLSKISRDLQEVAMRMRMVPVRGLFKKLARMVRELSRKVGKDVVLSTSGEGTEMDRSMVERLEEPLIHMIRNSIDHGVEDAEARERCGKSPTATIRFSAYHAGGSVVMEVADDGRGLARDAILKKAREQGLIRDGDGLADADVHSLIFAPGFSTASKLTEISGRGVGMDVVKRTIEAMRGRVHVASTSPSGTVFKIVLPLTTAIIDGMLIACGSEVYILPSLSIVESLQPTRAMLFSLSERDEMVNVRGELLPLIRLSRVFRIEGAQEDPTQALVVIVENLGRKVALVVDDVIDEQQVVIKSLEVGLAGAEFFSGAAILSNGRVGLILNVDRVGSMTGHDTRATARKRLIAEATS